MEAAVTWSRNAQRHLHRIHDLIAEDSAIYAHRFIQAIVRHAQQQLSRHPGSGRKVPEFENTPLDFTRELVYKGYRIIYNPVKAPPRVTILAVMSGRMDFNKSHGIQAE